MELFDLYDNNRMPLGKTIARGEKCPENTNRIVIHICLFNSKNEMLIQQRQSFKSTNPNMWDLSVGGCSVSGETSNVSAHRELLEELGIDYNFKNIRPHFTINFENGFDDFYLLNLDIPLEKITLQAEEVQDAKWASLDEILQLHKNGKFIPYPASFITALFDLKNKHGLF